MLIYSPILNLYKQIFWGLVIFPFYLLYLVHFNIVRVSAGFLGCLFRKRRLFYQQMTGGINVVIPDFSLEYDQFSDTLSRFTHENFIESFLYNRP